MNELKYKSIRIKGNGSHKMRCNNCGLFFDMRDLTQVIKHDQCEKKDITKNGN